MNQQNYGGRNYGSGNDYGIHHPNYDTSFSPPGGGPKKREIAIAVVLSIVTCGFYSLYWLYSLANDIKTLSREPNAMSGGMVLLLSIVTCGLYLLYWFFKQGVWVDEVRLKSGIKQSFYSILLLVLAIFGFGFVSLMLLQHEVNNML